MTSCGPDLADHPGQQLAQAEVGLQPAVGLSRGRRGRRRRPPWPPGSAPRGAAPPSSALLMAISKPPASPSVTMQYVTWTPRSVRPATVPAAPKSTSSGWAVTTSTRSIWASSSTAPGYPRPSARAPTYHAPHGPRARGLGRHRPVRPRASGWHRVTTASARSAPCGTRRRSSSSRRSSSRPFAKGPGYCAVTRHEDVWMASRNPQLFCSGKGTNIADMPHRDRRVLRLDDQHGRPPPRPAALDRRRRAFTPKEVSQIEGYVDDEGRRASSTR